MECHARFLNPGCVLVAALLAGPAAGGMAADAKDSKKAAAAPAAETKDGKPEPKKEGPVAKEPSDESGSKPTPHRVKKGPFRIEVALDGVFEAQNTTELVLRLRNGPASPCSRPSNMAPWSNRAICS